MIDALDALVGRTGDQVVRIGGHRLALSNIDKPMYVDGSMTKLDVMRYYARVAPVLLQHLRGRAMTMKRYPDGASADWFYHKRCPEHRPDWIDVSPPLGRSGVRYCLIEDEATLVWAANLASLELHAPLARAVRPDRPTTLVFDLDPGEGAGLLDCAFVARKVRDLLDGVGLDAYVKTSGSKGLQLYVPLNRPEVTFEHTKQFAHAVAHLLERQYPDRIVQSMAKHLRRGKVLIDWSQNDDSKTTVSVYSLRAKQRPTVSTPLTWHEVERACGIGDASGLTFEHEQVIERIERLGDLFGPVLRQQQSLPVFAVGAG